MHRWRGPLHTQPVSTKTTETNTSLRSLSIFSILIGHKELVLARAYIFPATTLQIPALLPTKAGEPSGSDP